MVIRVCFIYTTIAALSAKICPQNLTHFYPSARNSTAIIASIFMFYLYYNISPVRKNLSSKFDEFLACARNSTAIIASIFMFYLYYYSSPVRNNLSSTFYEFLAAARNSTAIITSIFLFYLDYYNSPVRKNLSSKFDEFLAGRSQFDSDHRVDFYAPTCCQSSTSGPLFAFIYPLFCTGKNN